MKLQIRALIRRYCRQRSAALALQISGALQALCVHPRCAITETERCAYRRLAQHWRCLAWVGENPSCAARIDDTAERPCRHDETE